MSDQQTAHLTCSEASVKGYVQDQTSFPLVFGFGPCQLARLDLALKVIDFGRIAISGEGFDAKLLPSDQPLFLRSAPDRLAFETSGIASSMLFYPFYSYPRSWVETEGGFEDYLQGFSRISRKGLKRRTKKLTGLSKGSLDIRRYDQADGMAIFQKDARSVSAKTFQEMLVNEGLPADQSFLHRMHQLALLEQCYGSILYLDDQPISYFYCEQQGSGWLATYGGFDPAYARLSPGTVHLLRILEDCFNDQQCALFDLGPGASGYKQFFSTHDVPCTDILILNKTVKNHLLVAAHRTLAALTEKCRALVETLKLRERLRQKLRGR